MPFVAGVRWPFRGKDAGSVDSRSYRCDRGRSLEAASAARRHNLYFAKPSYGAVSDLSELVENGRAPNWLE